MASREEKLENLELMLNEDIPYNQRLVAYEYLSENCEDIVDDMLEKLVSLEGDTANMLIEVLANYKGNKAIFMQLVSFLYKGEDVPLFARLIGSYGDEKGIDILQTFLDEYDPNYNEFMEIRNAIEELGGEAKLDKDFSDDEFYQYIQTGEIKDEEEEQV